MKTQTYIAAVHLIVRIEEGQAPEDAISEALTHNIGCEVNGAHNPGLVDWGYITDANGREVYPKIINLPNTDEGAFLQVI